MKGKRFTEEQSTYALRQSGTENAPCCNGSRAGRPRAGAGRHGQRQGASAGGKLSVIASLEEPKAIAKIPAHREKTAAAQPEPERPLGARAPPSRAGPTK